MENINGEWESTTLSGYMYLSIDGENNSFIVMFDENNVTSVARLDSFRFKEKFFLVRLVPLDDSESTDELYGSLYENRLQLMDNKKDDTFNYGLSFMKIGEIERLRPLAKKALEGLKKIEHNKAN